MFRLVCAADVHGSGLALMKIGGIARECKADAILLAGDIVVHSVLNSFVDCLVDVSTYAKAPIFLTPGNHDFWKPQKHFTFQFLDENGGECYVNQNKYDGVNCLIDGSAVIQSKTSDKRLKVHGTPWCRRYGEWAWMKSTEDELAERFALIPSDTDILICHSPPFGYGDHLREEGRTGSEALTQAIQARPNLKLVVFGHNHADGRYSGRIGDTVLMNVACHNDKYDFVPEAIQEVIVEC